MQHFRENVQPRSRWNSWGKSPEVVAAVCYPLEKKCFGYHEVFALKLYIKEHRPPCSPSFSKLETRAGLEYPKALPKRHLSQLVAEIRLQIPGNRHRHLERKYTRRQRILTSELCNKDQGVFAALRDWRIQRAWDDLTHHQRSIHRSSW
ncbi:hypothetical protein KM043_018658 [Ampulex compressa]|nr:hypothetical protein KM043_018658 [Ampulex compressa]